MILFVGDKPSKRTDPSVPFKGATCEQRLKEWVAYLQPGAHPVINRIDPNFRIIVLQYVDAGIPVIALGNNASKALGPLAHFKLPHPSGQNRQLNNKAFIISKLKECKKYIEKYSSSAGLDRYL